MKNTPYLIYANIALMFVILHEIYVQWDSIKADNSNFAIAVAITIPIVSLIACVIYIIRGKG